ncbi:FHA domain-containing protein [Tautonia plasticadhaerens]|uniref:FHA domain protein n=1 Tax=Tautonia plasticadhaerens TaxID=2527974 RepID=A0A518GY58_9BACT|nr:FHA domain-containing protein [Tautonia plasticadhaerens]QDV33515.1 FHA domain protein [Tautonia plasticadhaerens]
MQEGTLLGTMKPVGGGDPIPLKKKEVAIGRRPSSDIRLDFENVSGRHCVLSFINGTWHVRDLGSTNGTKINGQKLSRVQSIMPDDELAIASHLFHIDYEPAAPLVDSQQLLEEEEAIRSGEARKPTSLMELAGFTDDSRPRPPAAPRASKPRPEPGPPDGPGVQGPEAEPVGDDPPLAAPPAQDQDDDFFKLIEDEVRNKRG